MVEVIYRLDYEVQKIEKEIIAETFDDAAIS